MQRKLGQSPKANIKFLPKHERYLDAFWRYQFLVPGHLRHLFGSSLNARTLRFDLLKLLSAGYLRRTRSSRDEEYTYFPRSIREKSALMLTHTNEITWVQLLFDAGGAGFRSTCSERRPAQIAFAVTVPDNSGTLKLRRCIPDLFTALSNEKASIVRHLFWEITNAKPGQHWRKENDVVQKCQMYNAYFDSGQFVDGLQKKMGIVARNFRVVVTFPTEARANNFIGILRNRRIAYPGRFLVTWKEAYHAHMWEPIFLSPKDDSLHTLFD